MDENRRVRIDKWLWAARFFKTRSLAAKAVNGGKIHLNGKRIKAARIVQIGDVLHIQRGHVAIEVIVEGLNDRRRPAPEATLLYEETQQSIESREAKADERRLHRVIDDNFKSAKRPSKRDRRLIRNFTRKEE